MDAERTRQLRIRTPDGITFSLPLASPAARAVAWVIDLACIAVLSALVADLLARLISVLSVGAAMALQAIVYFVVSIGYGIALEWGFRGQTLGKRLLGLRVIDEHGLRLEPSQIVVRNLLRFVDALPALYLVGGLAALLSRHAQRLGDYAANTVVIRAPAVSEPDVEQLLAGKYNSFRAYPHLAARLRQRVSPAEATLALQALLRRDELAPDARVRLFRDLAAHFREIVRFPEEATLGLGDEQSVRNVVDICFRARERDLQGSATRSAAESRGLDEPLAVPDRPVRE